MSQYSKFKPVTQGVSASSFLELKAELAKHESEVAKRKALRQEKYVVGGIKRPDKKPTIWSRPNKGVAGRSARDVELEEISRPTIESARAALERKAKIYDKLRKGKSGGLNDSQYDALLVDFDQKAIDNNYESDSDDVDESLTVPKPEEEDDDPMVEYEDEFGRIRTAKRSELPRNILKPAETFVEDEDDPHVIRNVLNHFPVYQPSEERVASIAAAASEEANPLATHYDAAREVRAKGAAFYTFSAEETKRQREMEELRAARGETVRTREELGAVDVRPGDVDGMVAVESGTAGARSRAMEKRKRELEERRKLVDAKRRRVKGLQDEKDVAGPPADATTPAGPPAASSKDPLAALESQTLAPSKAHARSGEPQSSSTLAAHDFLAELEQDIFSRNKTQSQSTST